MDENKSTIFRQKTIERISSPEQLTDYLHVTNPGIWVILAAVILLLAGIFAWAAVGTLETKADVKVIVQDHTAQIIPTGAELLSDGMPLRVAGLESRITYADYDDYGRSIATAELDLPDGAYNGIVVVEETHPLEFLLASR